MGRRDIQTPVDPDTEAARAEGAAIESQKSTSIVEMEGLASTKKQLEEDIETGKKKMDDEFAAKRAELQREEQVLIESIDSKKKENKKLADEGVMLSTSKEVVDKALSASREEVQRLKTKSEILTGEVSKLKIEKSDLTTSIADDRKVGAELFEKKGTLSREVSDLEVKVSKLTTDHTDLVSKVEQHQLVVAGAKKAEAKALGEVDAINLTITEKRAELEKVGIDLAETQKQIADHKVAMAKRESEINEKAGNLARLEVRIDERMEQFKQLKEKVGVDAILKHGLNPNP